ncbi:MAG: acyl-homoserine-lactone synthase [Pseudomonadota bacterium]
MTSFFELRKAIFIDKMDWPLYAYERIEFEQYDTFNAVYIIAHDGGRALGALG